MTRDEWAEENPTTPGAALTRATDLLDAVDVWAQGAEVEEPPDYPAVALALRHACEALMGLAAHDPGGVLATAELMAAAVGVEA